MDGKINILLCVGARPNFIKAAAIINEINNTYSDRLQYRTVFTGQHDDYLMSFQYLSEFSIPTFHYTLESRPWESRIQRLSRMVSGMASVLENTDAKYMMVFGDTDSALAGALACGLTKGKIRLGHVEAGLRSFDPTMPEEMNRKLVDHIAKDLFTYCNYSSTNLSNEGCFPTFVGNVMIDTLMSKSDKLIPKHSMMFLPERLRLNPYILMTIHRNFNVDNSQRLETILSHAENVGKTFWPVVIPVHPRVKQARDLKKTENFIPIAPQSYVNSLSLIKEARLVITDSGGVQEEALWFKKPCLVVRPNTERKVTLDCGKGNIRLCEPEEISKAVEDMLLSDTSDSMTIPKLWDGKASQRILEYVLSKV